MFRVKDLREKERVKTNECIFKMLLIPFFDVIPQPRDNQLGLQLQNSFPFFPLLFLGAGQRCTAFQTSPFVIFLTTWEMNLR